MFHRSGFCHASFSICLSCGRRTWKDHGVATQFSGYLSLSAKTWEVLCYPAVLLIFLNFFDHGFFQIILRTVIGMLMRGGGTDCL